MREIKQTTEAQTGFISRVHVLTLRALRNISSACGRRSRIILDLGIGIHVRVKNSVSNEWQRADDAT